jgi:hypothetical protein
MVFLFVIFRPKKQNRISNTQPEYITERVEPIEYRVEPVPGEIKFGGSRISISVFFNYPIDLSTVKIVTDPNILLTPKMLPDFPERVILEPNSEWQSNINYTITIKAGVRAKNDENVSTNEDIKFQYKVLEMPKELENYNPRI